MMHDAYVDNYNGWMDGCIYSSFLFERMLLYNLSLLDNAILFGLLICNPREYVNTLCVLHAVYFEKN